MAGEKVALLLFLFSGLSYGIRLDGNGYKDILIAINPSVPENPLLIEKLKVCSKILHYNE